MKPLTKVTPQVTAALIFSAAVAFADTTWSGISADVVIIGEYHDNPQHHAVQADAIVALRPKAVVFEMLTPEEAEQLSDTVREVGAMRSATSAFHWSNIAEYATVLAASDTIVGTALSRQDMRAAFSQGAAGVFGAQAQLYGLTAPLPEQEQTEREQMQFTAHCEAMPIEMMGGMVEAQRLRDAAFAKTVIDAYEVYGAPIVLVTGNGHGRTDWGVPVYIAAAQPDLTVFSHGQGEGAVPPPGTFDRVDTSASVPERPDPCAAFQ